VGETGAEQFLISDFGLRIEEENSSSQMEIGAQRAVAVAQLAAIDVPPSNAGARTADTHARPVMPNADKVNTTPVAAGFIFGHAGPARRDSVRQPIGPPFSARVVPAIERHDGVLVGWVASRANLVRGGDDDRFSSRSEDEGDSSDSPFEAVDAVFEELLVAAPRV
jgi:hypothetical protein